MVVGFLIKWQLPVVHAAIDTMVKVWYCWYNVCFRRQLLAEVTRQAHLPLLGTADLTFLYTYFKHYLLRLPDGFPPKLQLEYKLLIALAGDFEIY